MRIRAQTEMKLPDNTEYRKNILKSEGFGNSRKLSCLELKTSENRNPKAFSMGEVIIDLKCLECYEGLLVMTIFLSNYNVFFCKCYIVICL